jgi:hypothetical protein
MAVWGICLSTLALALGIIGMVIVQDAVNDLDRELNELDDGPQQGLDDAGDVDGDGTDDCILFAFTDAQYEACFAAGSDPADDDRSSGGE